MLALLTLALGQAEPPIRIVPCENCAPAPAFVLDSLAGYDIEPAKDIYEPYFRCYWEQLSTNSAFGSTEASRAQAVLLDAGNNCAGLRADADRRMDRYLAERNTYGDPQNVVRVRDSFRQKGGILYMFMTASATGERDAYLTMMQAAARSQAND